MRVHIQAGPKGCDPGWILFPELQQCYLESTRYASRDAAEDYCRSFLTWLPYITSVEQQEAIASARQSPACPLMLPLPLLVLRELERTALVPCSSPAPAALQLAHDHAQERQLAMDGRLYGSGTCSRARTEHAARSRSRSRSRSVKRGDSLVPLTLQTFFNWADGEPKATEGLNCAVLMFNPTSLEHGRWFARNCSEAHHIFCKDNGTRSFCCIIVSRRQPQRVCPMCSFPE